MPLSSGTRVGAYEVIGLVGAGGMGEVYRALDTRLKREVALKVLPSALAGEGDRLLRFAREAEMLAALNHPNIAAIYGVEDAESSNPAEAGHHVRALVMELVEGETLAEQIARGPVPMTEALAIARQIAVALEAAHEQGIVHRDLKPANIKVRDDGTVKVLDFGLAKLADPVAAATGSSSMSLSPTITSPALMTNAGMLLGTAAYMSPEQAKGRPADKRSDMWAFGCVLFEMLTGKRAFEGEDVSETLAAVLRGEPEWSALPAATPLGIRTLIRRCLDRDRRKRVADSAAALFVFDEHTNLVAEAPPANRAVFESELETTVRTLERRAARRLAVSAVIGVLLIAVASVATWWVMRPGEPRVTRLGLAPLAEPAGIAANSQDVAITPDGSRVVYFTDPASAGGIERQTLAVRALDQIETVALRPVRSFAPFVSADGAWVGYTDQADRGLKKISILGGTPLTIAADVGALRGASWGPDDTIIFASVTLGSRLWRVSAQGGTPVPLTTPANTSTENHSWPHILPGGRAVLFTVGTPASGSRIHVLDLTTNQHRQLISSGAYPRYSPSGHIVYAVGSTLFAVGFDLDELVLTTEPRTVLEGVVAKESGAVDFDIAGNGTLVYVPGTGVSDGSRRLAFVTPSGHSTPVPGLDPGSFRSVHVNPAGTHIAFETGAAEGNLWTYDIARSVRNSLTTGEADDRNPIWHPTENRIVFGSNRDGRWGLFAVNGDGTGDVSRLMTEEKATEIWPHSFSRDGRTVLFGANFSGDANIGMLRLTGGGVDYPLRTPTVESQAAVSPDGAWVAYRSERSGTAQIYVERFPQLGDRRPISADVGLSPRWSRDGRQLFFLNPRTQEVMSVAITPGSNLVVAAPKVLFKSPWYQSRGWTSYDVMPDGRFVMIVRNEAEGVTRANPIVVQNWGAELKRLVPVN